MNTDPNSKVLERSVLFHRLTFETFLRRGGQEIEFQEMETGDQKFYIRRSQLLSNGGDQNLKFVIQSP